MIEKVKKAMLKDKNGLTLLYLCRECKYLVKHDDYNLVTGLCQSCEKDFKKAAS